MSKRPKKTDTENSSIGNGLTAGEFALGLGNEKEVNAAINRMSNDTDFRKEVAGWQFRLAELADEVEPVPAPASIWEKIDARTGGKSSESDTQASGILSNLAFLRVWSATTTALLLAVLTVGFLSYFSLNNRQPGPLIVANLTSTDAKPSFEIRLNNGILDIHSLNFQQNEKRIPQLWLVASDGVPRSLGLLAPNVRTRIKLNNKHLEKFEVGAALAVSLEPKGGAPNGKRTGPIIASGSVRKS